MIPRYLEVKPLQSQAKKIIFYVHTRMKSRFLRISKVGWRIRAANDIAGRCGYRKGKKKERKKEEGVFCFIL
jgi:hypothetical protein